MYLSPLITLEQLPGDLTHQMSFTEGGVLWPVLKLMLVPVAVQSPQQLYCCKSPDCRASCVLVLHIQAATHLMQFEKGDITFGAGGDKSFHLDTIAGPRCGWGSG